MTGVLTRATCRIRRWVMPAFGAVGVVGAVGASVGCAQNDVSVFDYPADGAAGNSNVSEAGPGCRSDTDCPPGWLCDYADCTSQEGICEPHPVFCPPDPAPVCGCDHVTYWNDCIRRQAGARGSLTGECRAGAALCNTGADCPVTNASCARLASPGEQCSSGPAGNCWVLPPNCAPSSDTLRWVECMPQVGPGPQPGICVDTCTAIRSERPYEPPPPGAMCP